MKPLSIECPNLTCIINQSQPEWTVKGQKILKKNVVLKSSEKRTLGQFYVLKIAPAINFLEESRATYIFFRDFLTFMTA